MKYLVRISLLSALLCASTTAGQAQMSDDDMGFSPSTSQSASSAALSSGSGGGGNTEAAATGKTSGNDTDTTQGGQDSKKTDKNSKVNTRTGTGLLAPNSVGSSSFAGPQNLGFKGGMGGGGGMMGLFGGAPQTGTGSVKTKITAANGKD